MFDMLYALALTAHRGDIGGDAIHGQVGDDGENIAIGKGHHQQSNRYGHADSNVTVNVGNRWFGGSDHNRRPATTEEILQYLLILVDGDERLGVMGMRRRLRLVSMAIVANIILLLFVLLLQIAQIRGGP